MIRTKYLVYLIILCPKTIVGFFVFYMLKLLMLALLLTNEAVSSSYTPVLILCLYKGFSKESLSYTFVQVGTNYNIRKQTREIKIIM